MNDNEIVEEIDNLVEEVTDKANAIAARLGLDSDEVLDRIATEIKARLL